LELNADGDHAFGLRYTRDDRKRFQKKEQTEECSAAAMTDYVKANDALVQQTATVMSVEATIAQRRLQEEYCLRFVRCSLDDQNSAIFQVQFDSCLKDEALEKYGAIPGDTD
jgi:hypothetical protein